MSNAFVTFPKSWAWAGWFLLVIILLSACSVEGSQSEPGAPQPTETAGNGLNTVPAETATPLVAPTDTATAPESGVEQPGETPTVIVSTEHAAEIAWLTMAQGDSFIADQEQPAILIATSNDELRQITDLLNSPEDASGLENVDFENQVVVAAFRGIAGSSGYTITVDSVVMSPDNVVTLTVLLADPPQDSNEKSVESYPYHIISMPRSSLNPAGETAWKMIDKSGSLLAEASTAVEPAEHAAEIAWLTMAQGDSFIADQEQPALLIATSNDELRQITDLLNSPEDSSGLKNVDFENQVVVAAFRGRTGSSGYTITVDSVAMSPDNIVTLTVLLADPPQGSIEKSVESYPYHIVSMPRSSLNPTGETTWRMIDESGSLLAETSTMSE